MGLKLWPDRRRLHSYDRQVAADTRIRRAWRHQACFFWMPFNRPRLATLLIAFLLGASAAACQPAASPPALLPTATSPPPSSTSVTVTPSPDVIVGPEQFNQPITIQTGQTFLIASPDPSSKWQMEFDPDLFESLGTDEAGWRFRAIAAGEGLIMLTGVVTCDQPQPCPLMPQHLELIIEVKGVAREETVP